MPGAFVATEEKPEAVMCVAVAAAAAAIPRRSGAATPEIHLDENKLFVQLGEKNAGGSACWILDTGATNHMTGQRDAFSELDTGVRGTVRFGDGSVVAIEGRGTILFKCKNGAHQVLAGVYYIPRLKARIISLGQLDEDGYKVLIEMGVLMIWDQARRLLIKVERSPSRLYILDTDIDKPVCLAARCSEVAWKWHARFGHLGFQALRALSKGDMVRGLPSIEQVEQLCDSCLAGKQRRHTFPATTKYRAPNLLELVHADLCGPITPETPGSKRSFLLIVDDKSRFMWLVLLASKDQAGQALIQFQARAEVESGRKLGTLRTDRGEEFTARAFAEHCAEYGVQRHLTAPYTPQQNGVVERRNQTVLGMARSMMKAKKVPGW
jgi:transposase InsO family protein